MIIKNITGNFSWVGTLDPGLRVFDIVMRTEYGTTYNSYLLRGNEKTVLFETTKAGFADEYIQTLEEAVGVRNIDILVQNHTEPDHSGTIERLLEINPSLEIRGTACALNFLNEIINRDINGIIVKDGDELSIGGKTLRFIVCPNLHWPDTMFTYIPEDNILVSCDAFGAHYSYEGVVFDANINRNAHMKAAAYYFDMIMGPFKADVLKALARIDGLPIDIIATGHGPVLTENPKFMIDLYRQWASAPAKNAVKTVIIPYVSAYGYTKTLAETIAKGIQAAAASDSILIKLFDMAEADLDTVMDAISKADGLLLGTPTIVGEALPPIWDIVSRLNAKIHCGLFAGAFGSYGWSGEGVPHIMERLRQLKLNIVGDGLRTRFKADDEAISKAHAYGKEFAAALLNG